ncbi:MAG TPA: MarR family transcriptional regulator [Steroidobacteraceae bacterium]|jgi:DNA-binding MarR family transcriptional regulator
MDRLRNFGFLIKDISRLHGKNFERHALGLNMTLAQCKVLAHLERNEGISQVKLAELSDTDPMTLVRILDRMEGDGWVERRAHPGDRRARQLFLKKAAMPVVQEMWRIADRARTESLAGLSAADREQLLELLTRIHANLNSMFPATAAGECASEDSKAPSTAKSAAAIPASAAKPRGRNTTEPARATRKQTKS